MNQFKNLINYIIFLCLTAILASCSGTGQCGSCAVVPTPGPGSLSLKLTAPNQYPAGVAVTAYLTITNTSATNATNLVYSVPPKNQPGNTTDVNITIDPNGAGQGCANIPAGASCTFTANIPAGSIPGSFTVTAISSASSSLASKLSALVGLNQTTLTLTAYIGLTDLPPNDLTGANGITLLYAQYVESYPNNESTPVIITAVVNSASAGEFNTISLADKNGNPLHFETLSSNSGNTKPALTQGSIVTLLLHIPAGNSIYPVYAQTSLNGAAVQTASNAAVINLTGQQGYITALPYMFNLNSSYPSQTITYTNPSSTRVTNLSFVSSSNLIIESAAAKNTCGSTLESGQSCFITVSADLSQPLAQTNAYVTAQYKDPVNSAQVVVNGTISGRATSGGLLITSTTPLNFYNNSVIESMATVLTFKNTGTQAIIKGYLDASIGVSLSPNFAQTYFVATGGSCTLTDSSGFYPVPLIAITNTLQPGESCTVNLIYNSANQYVVPSAANIVATYFYSDIYTSGTTPPLPLTYSSSYSGIGVTLHEDSPTGRVIDNAVIGQNEYFYIVLSLVNESGTIPTQTITADTSNGYQYPDGNSCQISSQTKSCSIKALNTRNNTRNLVLSNSGGLAVSPNTIPLYVAQYAYVVNVANGNSSTYNATDVYKCLYNEDTGVLYPNCRAQSIAQQLNINNFNPQKIIVNQEDEAYITDSGNGKVYLCMTNESGNLTSCVSTGSGYQFTNAHGVALSNQGYLYVATQKNGINGITTCSITPVINRGDRPELFDCTWASPFGNLTNSVLWLANSDYSYLVNNNSIYQTNLWYASQPTNGQAYNLYQSESTVNHNVYLNGQSKANTSTNSLAYAGVNNPQLSAIAVQVPTDNAKWLFYSNLNETKVYSCGLYYEYNDPTPPVGGMTTCSPTGSSFSLPDDIFVTPDFGYISNLTPQTDISLCQFDSSTGTLSNCQASGAGTFSGARAFYLKISLK